MGFSNQLVKTNSKTYGNIWKTATGQGDDYTIGCLLDYLYFKTYFKIIAIDLSKQQELDVDTKATQHIKFYWKSRSTRKHNNVFHIWRSKRNHFTFFTRNYESTANVFYNLFCFNIISIKNGSIKHVKHTIV